LAAVGVPALVAVWWAFRPEKLWIDQKVNEATPFDTSGGPQPILTGRFEGKSQQTSGRATLYKKPGGEEYLRLTDFTTSNGGDVHVVLARSGDQSPAHHGRGDDSVDLGPLKGIQGDQDYDLPLATDMNKYGAVVVYSEQSQAAFGVAKLEPF
jgi:hypothetical protein